MGTEQFQVTGEAYDSFMGRYSTRLARPFWEFSRVPAEGRVLDVGCGPGALTAVAVEQRGAGRVSAVDPAASMVAALRVRLPDVDVHQTDAAHLPFPDDAFAAALAELVLHFVPDPDAAVAELQRVVRSGGVIAACTWEFAHGMQMLRVFWDAALSVRPQAPDEARTLRFGKRGEIADLFRAAGLRDVTETFIAVTAEYTDFDELWAGFLAGVGPAGGYLVAQDPPAQDAIRRGVRARIGHADGPFELSAVAVAARGVVV